MDFLSLLLPLLLACGSVAVSGWTVNGLGPATLLVAGGVWHFWMQWLRYRIFLRHRDSGFVPGTQHLALSGLVGLLLGMCGGTVWLCMVLQQRKAGGG